MALEPACSSERATATWPPMLPEGVRVVTVLVVKVPVMPGSVGDFLHARRPAMSARESVDFMR